MTCLTLPAWHCLGLCLSYPKLRPLSPEFCPWKYCTCFPAEWEWGKWEDQPPLVRRVTLIQAELSMALPMAYLPLHILTIGDGLRFFPFSHSVYNVCQLQVFVKILLSWNCNDLYTRLSSPRASGLFDENLYLSHLQSQDKAQCWAYRKHLELQS